LTSLTRSSLRRSELTGRRPLCGEVMSF
jgi:hypothetical protein